MSIENNASNLFFFYEQLVDTKCANLKDEIVASMEEHKTIAYFNEEEGWGRSVTQNEYFQFRAKDESKLVFQYMRDQILSVETQQQEKLYYQLSSQISAMVNYLRKQKFMQDSKKCFVDELELVKEQLKTRFNFSEAERSFTSEQQSKIKWLGKTNALAGLFYDLWHGQEKGKGIPTTKKMLETDKKQLTDFLINNFIDSKGEQLTEGTISDYLNSSKLEKRPKRGARIELDTP